MTQLAIHLSKSCQTIKGHKQFTLKQKHINVETTAIHKHEKNSSTISLVALNNSSASQLAYQKTKGNTNTEDRHSKSAKTKFLNSHTAYKNTILSNHLFQTSTFSNSSLLAAGFKTQQIPTTLGWHCTRCLIKRHTSSSLSHTVRDARSGFSFDLTCKTREVAAHCRARAQRLYLASCQPALADFGTVLFYI